MKRLLFLGLVLWLNADLPIRAQSRAPSVEEVRFFETRIRPLLANQCFRCHGPEKQESNLRFDSAEGLQRGGKSGEALIVPGKPEASRLIRIVQHEADFPKMPKDGKLTEAQLADLVRWVKMGAPYPRTVAAPVTSKHWAFQPPVDPAVPAVKDKAWPKSPLDHFILAGLEAKGLRPSAPMDQRTLIRRATFDLTGLPPTPEEIEAFLKEADAKPQAAYEGLIDRLLASPAYGERWGRHWLDVARYADSNGLDENVALGNAWRYRDYVVAAFNKDKPYDQFLLEQIAGDLLPGSDPATRTERLIATGFLGLGPKVLAEPDPKKMEMDIIDEQVDTLGRAFMGLTLGCARCHDHKFDPISTEDYYGLAGIFISTKTMEHFKKVARWHENSLATPEEQARQIEHQKNVARLRETIKTTKDAAELKKLKDELALLEKSAPVPASALGATEGTITNTPVLLRGNHLTPGKVVPRHFPIVLAGEMQPALGDKGSGRLELANWLIRKDHPLTACVMVNRVWRWHFGQGLVRSVDNFGRLGEKPSHPELLDWLAQRFVESGWSLKSLHRRIMLSATYRMSSAHDAASAAVDPDNRLQWRTNIRRLEAEAIRDSLLAVGGTLDPTIGGPALQHVKNRDYLFDHTSKDKTTYDSHRRSIYLPVIRNNLYDVFQLFDATDATVGNGDRATTTVATQALFWLNSPLVMEAAEKMTAVRPSDQNLTNVRDRLRRYYLIAYGREPTEREAARMSQTFAEIKQDLRRADTDPQKVRERAWALLGQVILSANEFIYVK